MKKNNYKNFEDRPTQNKSVSFKLSFDTSFIPVGKKLVEEVDFENLTQHEFLKITHKYFQNLSSPRIFQPQS